MTCVCQYCRKLPATRGYENTYIQIVKLAKWSNPIVIVILAATILWIAWRIWTFTIKPLLNPKEPREMPYSIPCELKNVQSMAHDVLMLMCINVASCRYVLSSLKINLGRDIVSDGLTLEQVMRLLSSKMVTSYSRGVGKYYGHIFPPNTPS